MQGAATIVFETDTQYAHYQVWDMLYDGRPARVLYSGQRQAAQSGIARDSRSDLLFDYNQRFLELVSGVLPTRLLLIGGGMYTLPMALLPILPSLTIDVVELDADLDAIAARFFNLKPDHRLRIIHADGRDYLDHNTTLYDMILIDAFTHTAPPDSLVSAEAVAQYKRSLKDDGIAATNIISALQGRGADDLKRLAKAYKMDFRQVDIFPATQLLSPWLSQNLVLVAQAGHSRPITSYLRHPPLDHLI